MSQRPVTSEQIAEVLRAVQLHNHNKTEAAISLGIPRGTFENRLHKAYIAFPSLRPVSHHLPRFASNVPASNNQQVNSESLMKLHRAERQAMQARSEATMLRTALEDQERKFHAYTALREAKPTALEWTMAKPAVGKRNVLMPALVLSDFQAGEVIKPGELEGLNTYSIDIFKERYRTAIEKTITLAGEHVGKADFPGIQYWNLGDVISGGIHSELAETDDLPSVPAIRAVFQCEREGIKQLRAKFGRVHVVRVNGNHDRNTLKTRSKNQAGQSYGTLLSWWLQSAFENDPNITWHVPSSPDALVRVFGWNVLLTHGDTMGSGGGKGFIGPEAPIIRGHHSLHKNWTDGGQRPDLICTGHYHTELKTVRGYGNGTMAGYSQYGRTLRAIPDAARQWLLFLHQEMKVAHNFSLQLSSHPQRSMLEYAA